MQKSFPVEIRKATNEKSDARFVLSASSPDRVNDTIDPKAWESNLGKKIIALWQHESRTPIGFFDDLIIRGKRLIGELKISSTQIGGMVRQLLSDEVPLGASIGFRGKGEPNERGGIHYTDIEIFEVSIVSVPAHPLAVQISKQLELDPVQGSQSSQAMSGQNISNKAKNAIERANQLIEGT